MTNTCLTCRYWQISETAQDGTTKLTWWGRNGYGQCLKEGAGHYKPRAGTCPAYRAADEETVKRREKALAAAQRQNARRQIAREWRLQPRRASGRLVKYLGNTNPYPSIR